MQRVADRPEQAAIRVDLGAIFVSLELSRSTWLITSLSPGGGEKMSKHAVRSGDVAGLLGQLEMLTEKARARTGKRFRIIVIQEAGLDGFWIHRVLRSEGIESHVVDAASILVSRRRRRAKTDKIDGETLVRTLLAYKRGEPRVCSMVKPPTPEEEDCRRISRERKTLIAERVKHVNRIKGLLFAQGIRGINVKSQYKTLAVDKLITGDGHRLPPRLACEIAREIQRLAVVQEQIAEIECERDTAPTPCEATERKRLLLLQLKSIGPAISALLSREVYYRQFVNRRQVGSFLGLTPSPHSSGEEEHCQGISRAGSGPVRAIMIETAWLWTRHQPKSALTRWFVGRTAGQSTRMRKIMIVAVARKLAIALWRYVEHGLVPQAQSSSRQ